MRRSRADHGEHLGRGMTSRLSVASIRLGRPENVFRVYTQNRRGKTTVRISPTAAHSCLHSYTLSLSPLPRTHTHTLSPLPPTPPSMPGAFLRLCLLRFCEARGHFSGRFAADTVSTLMLSFCTNTVSGLHSFPSISPFLFISSAVFLCSLFSGNSLAGALIAPTQQATLVREVKCQLFQN